MAAVQGETDDRILHWGEADVVELAMRAREDVRSRLPWWWGPFKRGLFLHAVEVYVRAVLIAFHREAIQGWPPQPDGTPTVDQALQRRRARRRVSVPARKVAGHLP